MTEGSKPLDGRSAIVTGSTSGIGLEIARGLADAGARVMLNGFGEPAEIERQRAALAEAAGVEVSFSGADMSKGDQVVAMVREAEEAFGAVDILVSNAGIQHVAPIEEFPPAKWEAILAINLSAAFYGIHAALAGMKRRGFGRLINVASAHGLRASPYKSAYVAAKHGMVGLTKTVALEVAEQNITCNAICPGYVKTPLVEGQIDEQAEAHKMSRERVIREVILASQPNKRFIETGELAALTVFLCTDAGRSITGAALSVDGGWTAR
ncbi:MAG: 3-hydroxybutyrate dehydrogenase [Geminicoccaceae bacterium]|nr:3-hydroxybutyrate dehydrogenase [Geminicoccaceae bacterium]